MGEATYAIPNFLGGEISKFAQGRFDKPDYRTSLNVCLNSYPVEMGGWTRRPGTRHAGFTRGGSAGRTIKFDFEQAASYTLEFTDGYLRFRSGASVVVGADDQVVVAVSAANPAVVQTTTATTWATGDRLVFPGASTPLLENREFTATKVDSTHFSLADAITGTALDGATLGALVAGATVARIHELVTSYTGGSWAGIRTVQAETTDIVLCGTVAPQALTVTTLPTDTDSAVFAITDATFLDGPYLDPFTNGVQATPSLKTGVIGITLAFSAYSATKAYAIGDFVTSSSVNYRSLVDQNVNNAPATSPTQWAATSAGAAINDGAGFLGTDVGRLVRLFSEPSAWAVGTTYAASTAAAPVIVSYNPTGLPGQTSYWSSLAASNIAHAPGSDLLNWQLVTQGAAIWTWGRITALSNIIDRVLAGSTSIGDMTGGGGINAVFNGLFTQSSVGGAAGAGFTGGTNPSGQIFNLKNYAGKNYSAATDQVIQQATVYPTPDVGFGSGRFLVDGNSYAFVATFTLYLRGKATLPANSSDGTLLGQVVTLNTTSPITIVSNDQTTAWKYVWVEMNSNIGISVASPSGSTAMNFSAYFAQVSFFGPTGTGASAGVSVEILGPPLLYTNPIMTWRLGAYSDTTGWPTCGTYFEGRIWLGGGIRNRFDCCVSNGIDGNKVNFAPTDQYGQVAGNNAISYTLNSDSVNPIYWMKPDLQGIMIGTQAGEWLVQAPTTGPISPTNIAARRVTKIGSANVEPCRTEHTNIFAQRYRRKLMEHFADAYSGKFTAPNIADKAEHLTRASIAEVTYTGAVTPVIWGRCDDGSLFGITYKRDTLTTAQPPTFYGWHSHTLGSGRTVESLCAGPSPGGDLDTLTMVTTDAANLRHVEVLTDAFDELSELTSAWFLDNAVNPTSVTSSEVAITGAPYGGLTINGLWHLNGKTVQVWAGGVDCGDPGEGKAFVDFVVASGSVFVPYGDGLSAGPGRGLFTAAFAAALALTKIVVGFTYDSDGQGVREIAPADSGARNGPALGKTRRNHRYSMLLSNTLGLKVGGAFAAMYPVPLKKADNATQIDALTMFSGVVSDVVQDNYSYDGMLCWRVSRPYPANVIAISGNLQTQDR